MPKLQDQSLQQFEVLEQSVINLLWATWPVTDKSWICNKTGNAENRFRQQENCISFFLFFFVVVVFIGTPNAKMICKKPFKNCSHEQWSVMYILIGRKMGTLFNVLIEIHL